MRSCYVPRIISSSDYDFLAFRLAISVHALVFFSWLSIIINSRVVIYSRFKRDNAFAVMEEFWQQGDEDRMLGKPVDLMYDRELAHEMPVGQIGIKTSQSKAGTQRMDCL